MPAILLQNATLLDCTGAPPRPETDVLVEDGRILRIGGAGSVAAPDGARRIDCAGMTLMPGLTDAHVHFGLTEATANDPPESHVSYVLKVVENIGIALDEGFTTVRDAGGLDPAYAVAVEQGQVRGPRILPAGAFLTVTGGHGDQRHAWTHEHPPEVPGLRTHSAVVDGPDAVRRAAREQMRRGATQVKLHVSGGIMSPSDPLESLQFTADEIRAAVEEAEAFGRYVVVHAHTSPAIQRALDAGVRSIEHGSILDEATAKRIAADGVYLGPTLVILEILARADHIPAFARQKLDLVREESRRSVKLAQASGVKLTSGSDLLGPRQSRRASEIAEKAKQIGAMEAIVSATRTNAELFRMRDRIGTVEEGKDADVILVAGDPLADVGVLVDAVNIRLVLKSGVVVKDLT